MVFGKNIHARTRIVRTLETLCLRNIPCRFSLQSGTGYAIMKKAGAGGVGTGIALARLKRKNKERS